MNITDLFAEKGVHAVCDGQFGSTGKGVLAAWIARHAIEQKVHFNCTVSNAGPNSGHTFYHNGEKHVLKQLPTFAVASSLVDHRNVTVVLSGGSIINPQVLLAELNKYPDVDVVLAETAAVITPEDIAAEHSGSVAAVAGTRSGTGAVLARKVLRDPNAIAKAHAGVLKHPRLEFGDAREIGAYLSRCNRIFLEVSQGFSLGLHSQFYPKVTSRECTVAQGMADAQLPCQRLAKVYMSMRTFPIRVGNVDGHSSGDWYSDQEETSWDKLEVDAERTTVTNRIRRVATFSKMQMQQAVRANNPDFIFMNFMNYIPGFSERYRFLKNVIHSLDEVGSSARVIPGYGPTFDDVGWKNSMKGNGDYEAVDL